MQSSVSHNLNPESFNILFVDDDPAICRLIEKFLEKEGYKIRIAKNGHDAWEKITQDCPDILITDWMMQGMSGIELITKLRSQTMPRYTYCLLMTARNSPEDIASGLDAGANDFISKPVSDKEFIARLHAGMRTIQLEQSLRKLSECDALTGVLNRRTFHSQIEREWSRSCRYEEAMSVVIMDVDFFKKVNDDLGHSCGDAVLVNVAQLLQRQCRPSDYVCRFGGEEFVVLLGHTDEAGATIWADRVRAILEQMTIQLGEKEIHVTASFGVAERLTDTKDPATLIDMADQCLLVAKQSGRNRVISYQQLKDPLLDPFSGHGHMEHPLDGALARDVMSTLVISLNESDSAQQAVDLVLQLRIASVPVTNDEGQLVGIISEKDLMQLDVAEDGWNQTVGAIMKKNVVSYEETTPAKDIFNFLCRVAIRRVVVVSQGIPVGMISRDTYLRWYANWLTTHKIESPEDEAFAQYSAEDRIRDGINLVAISIINQTKYLIKDLQEYHTIEEGIPSIVGGATRLQDLVNDLLGHCQHVHVR